MQEEKNTPQKPGVYVHTFGCQMNVHDSQKILTLMSEKGYQAVETPEEASVILLNTCSVREKPEQKVLSAVGRYRNLKQNTPDLIIGVGGCFARQEGEDLLRRAPALDLVFGPDNIPELPKMIQNIREEHQPQVETEFDPSNDVRFLDIAPQVLDSRVTAMVTIMKGCDKYCSFCIVPYVRGRERYRDPVEIKEEVQRLSAQGIREIMLLGQSVTSYKWKDRGEVWDLARLIRSLDGVEGLDRLRFTSPYPRDFHQELIDCFAEVPILCDHVHLPFQSGSDRILYRMNRRHTREQYFGWVNGLRERCPSIAITADVIVGFPGEEEQDFEETMDLIERVRFDALFSFKYSPRPKTPAARKVQQISEEDKQRRLAYLQQRQLEISLEINKKFEGTEQLILVEGRSRRNPERLAGRTTTNKVVNFVGPEHLVGEMINIRIIEAHATALVGEGQ
ncbi:MAG: tRNA (N6-isopentenyl adenosine(37)-C2)-methylthiotransferase MiaB [Myxococcales bacterium]|nr:tRNA (N6-isopentenyl adenosine(37)-C2)-methylthiotransferase MiaB [Myxococcales bacterium]MCB9643642.1 tRNA (N6-isopentenyl adenosine(37)-C2)-methylthiotransferase MiaB [Myxococcales bacterium]